MSLLLLKKKKKSLKGTKKPENTIVQKPNNIDFMNQSNFVRKSKLQSILKSLFIEVVLTNRTTTDGNNRESNLKKNIVQVLAWSNQFDLSQCSCLDVPESFLHYKTWKVCCIN